MPGELLNPWRELKVSGRKGSAVDRPENKARFLILGSASPDLVKNASETLAGRVEFVELSGFDLQEAGTNRSTVLWLRG
jgi:hypothetical protein